MGEPPDAKTVTRLLQQIGAGEDVAYDQLIPLIYDELRRIAAAQLRNERPNHTLQPTALANEAYLKIVGLHEMAWRDRQHFFGAASGAIRRILVDHARKHRAQKRGGDAKQVSLDTAQLVPEQPRMDMLALDEALHELASLDERQSRIVELRFFGGMTVPEVASVLDVSQRTIEGDWTMAKRWLRKQLSEEN